MIPLRTIYINPQGTPHLVRGGHIRELHLVGHFDWQNAIPDARLHAQWVTLLDRGDLTPVIPR